jgi:hypothetical protein
MGRKPTAHNAGEPAKRPVFFPLKNQTGFNTGQAGDIKTDFSTSA